MSEHALPPATDSVFRCLLWLVLSGFYGQNAVVLSPQFSVVVLFTLKRSYVHLFLFIGHFSTPNFILLNINLWI